jgi:hypothetical protein
MKIIITAHAKERMEKYNVNGEMLNECIENPDNIIESQVNRKIYQKKLNGYLLRAIVEESKEIKTIITTYKARRERYEI